MAQRQFHYEQAFEHYLRANRIPYVAVDEARKTLLPLGAAAGPDPADHSLKSFDFVVYQPGRNLLVDVKGRQFGSARAGTPLSNRRLESWVTRGDVEGLRTWQGLFGRGFQGVFVFIYCLHQQPPDALFEEILCYGGRWYVLREVTLDDYERAMVQRSRKWGTVHLPRDAFARVSRPFAIRDRAAAPVLAGRGPVSYPERR